MSEDVIKAKLLKLLALARRGEGGEKEKAGNLLATLLAKHNLSLEDLEREDLPRRHREYAYQTPFEEKLLLQIVAQVLNSTRFPVYTRKGKRVSIFDLTEPEYLEMELRWVTYRAAWEKEQTRFFNAFVQAQEIFPASPQTNRSSTPRTAQQQEDDAAILLLMAGVKRVSVRRALPTALGDRP